MGYLIGAIVFFHIVIIAAQKWLGPLDNSAAVLSEEALRARDIALYGQAGKGDLDDSVLDVDDEVHPRALRAARMWCLHSMSSSQGHTTTTAVPLWCHERWRCPVPPEWRSCSCVLHGFTAFITPTPRFWQLMSSPWRIDISLEGKGCHC